MQTSHQSVPDVLLIEDNLPFATIASQVLKPAKADIALSLGDALQRIAAKHYDVLVVDLCLPDSGPESTVAAIPELRRRSGAARVVVVTGAYARYVDPTKVEAVLTKGEEGMPGCLAKAVFGNPVS